jgi:hypothetical protein
MFGYLTYMMPYIYVSQVDTPCTLLVEIAGELQDVAKGKILRPTQKLMHNMSMPTDVLRVEVLAPLPGFENFAPPPVSTSWGGRTLCPQILPSLAHSVAKETYSFGM